MQILIVTLPLIAITLRALTIVRGDIVSTIIILISLMGTVAGGLSTILGSILKKLTEQGINLHQINLILIGYVLLFTVVLFGIYLISGNAIILTLGGVIGVLLPFIYGYYVSRKKEEHDREHRGHSD